MAAKRLAKLPEVGAAPKGSHSLAWQSRLDGGVGRAPSFFEVGIFTGIAHVIV